MIWKCSVYIFFSKRLHFWVRSQLNSSVTVFSSNIFGPQTHLKVGSWKCVRPMVPFNLMGPELSLGFVWCLATVNRKVSEIWKIASYGWIGVFSWQIYIFSRLEAKKKCCYLTPRMSSKNTIKQATSLLREKAICFTGMFNHELQYVKLNTFSLYENLRC